MKYSTILTYLGFSILLLIIANYIDYWTIVNKSIMTILDSRPLYIIIPTSLILAPILSILALRLSILKHLDVYVDEFFGLLLVIILVYIFIFYNSSLITLVTEPLYIIAILLVFTPIRIILEHFKLLIEENNPLKIGILTINFYILMMIIHVSRAINVWITGNYLQDLGFRFSMLTLYMIKYILPSLMLPVTLEQSIAYLKTAITTYQLPELFGLLFMILIVILLFKSENNVNSSSTITILFYSSLTLLVYLLLFNSSLFVSFQLIAPWILLLLTIIILSVLGVLK